MDEELERMVVAVRADTRGFAADVQAMRAELDGTLGSAADRAGGALEAGLARAVRTGRLGFEDLGRVALSVLGSIAASAVRSGVGSILGSVGGLIGMSGLPGRATGGPVAPGRAYLVGERGPELFVPTASGAVAPSVASAAREVRVTVSVAAPAGVDGPRALERSSRQVGRAVRRALEG
jgi:phage-related minor tail protein